jgi:hypothetical protein
VDENASRAVDGSNGSHYVHGLDLRTPWEQSRDRTGHAHDEIAIIFGTANFLPFSLSRALLTICKAFLFGALERGLRNQDALTFVAAT